MHRYYFKRVLIAFVIHVVECRARSPTRHIMVREWQAILCNLTKKAFEVCWDRYGWCW